jgi:hypothetical protein
MQGFIALLFGAVATLDDAGCTFSFRSENRQTSSSGPSTVLAWILILLFVTEPSWRVMPGMTDASSLA